MNAQSKIEATVEHGLALLREPFAAHHISKLPKETKAQIEARRADKTLMVWKCEECGGAHHKNAHHLDYVGHAALTDRLLDADPLWSWEPAAFNEHGLPAFDQTGGLWIKLTVCGVTRLGYGHAAVKQNQDPGAREKEVIGDALRNAAMRFGAALDLWHKGDLHADDEPPAPEPKAAKASKSPFPAGPAKGIHELKQLSRPLYRDLAACGDADQLDIVKSDNKALIAQIEAAWPDGWNGIDGDGNKYPGFKDLLEQEFQLENAP